MDEELRQLALEQGQVIAEQRDLIESMRRVQNQLIDMLMKLAVSHDRVCGAAEGEGTVEVVAGLKAALVVDAARRP